MNTVINFEADWNGENKIRAIKALRTATGCSLKQGKTAVEAAEDRHQSWRMTPAQFGIFIANNLSFQTGNDFYVTAIVVVTEEIPFEDFTNVVPF